VEQYQGDDSTVSLGGFRWRRKLGRARDEKKWGKAVDVREGRLKQEPTDYIHAMQKYKVPVREDEEVADT
jgi:hypothetical protein